MEHTSGEDLASSIDDKAKPYRGAKALDSLSGACERQGVTAAATRPKGIESAAIEQSGDVEIADNGPYVVEREWTAKAVRSPLTGKRAWLPLEAGCPYSGGLFGQAQGKRPLEALWELLNTITDNFCNAGQRPGLIKI